jgi:hypothetical protein
MKILIVGIIALATVAMVGCTTYEPYTLPTPSTTQVTQTTALPIATTSKTSETPNETELRLYNDSWISPAEVNIGNYYSGATAEWTIKIHNGNNATPQYESFSVITEKGETIVPIALAQPLAGSDYSKVMVISDNSKESLKATGYDAKTKEITISGFIPEVSRIITINYIAWTEFKVYYIIPNNVRDGFSIAQTGVGAYVTFSETVPVLAPKETREILVRLAVPSDYKIYADKWEYWVVVTEQGQGNIQTQMAIRWLVTMR